MNLKDILLVDRFPHTANISLGDGRKLAVTYRPAPPDAAERLKSWLKAELAALGFDPEIGWQAMKGRVPKGEAGEKFEAAFVALGDDADEIVTTLGKRAEGFALSLYLGSWSLVDEKGATAPLADPIDADSCASLPADLKRAVLDLADGATLSSERAGFLGMSPRS